jgi:enamine deaminase RidA (YjgF/YER057c/UK114 family)
LRVLGMVNVSPQTPQLAGVVNGFSELIVEVFGKERGAHARSAVGMAELPFGVAVEIEAEVEIE